MNKMFIFPLLFFAMLLPAGQTAAQLNNKPFSFKTPGGGVGMSLAGKQAISNEKIFGTTPKNLLRYEDGRLLSVTRGPGNVAIAAFEGNGGFLPTYKGSSFRGGNTDMSVGVFNTFFSPGNKGVTASNYASRHTSASVSTWTARVTSGGMPISFSPDSPVDTWTGMVHSPY